MGFRILAEKKQAALQAIKDLKGKGTIEDDNGRHFSWVEDSEFVNAQCLEEALEAWGWYPDTDKEGNIVDLSFENEKFGDEKILFDTIAPFVEDGSYLQVSSWEERESWRWVFNDGKCEGKKTRMKSDEL